MTLSTQRNRTFSPECLWPDQVHEWVIAFKPMLTLVFVTVFFIHASPFHTSH